MAENMKEINNLADSIETNVDNNEIRNTQEVLRNPQQKRQVIDYLKQNEGEIGASIKKNLLDMVVLQAKWESTSGKENNPYQGAKELYEKLFNVKIETDGSNITIKQKSKDSSSEIQNSNRQDKITKKQEQMIALINQVPEFKQFPAHERALFIDFLTQGDLTGINFTRDLANKYSESRFGSDPSKEEKATSIMWAKQIRGALQMNNLREEAKKISRLEKRKD